MSTMPDSNNLGLLPLKKLLTSEQMKLLDAVDSLRACGLSDIIALPQLIVCGDQSSGKSSLLEALSGIPFPKQETLCTRFATEVILRRAANVEINVSIVPGDDRGVVDRDRLLETCHQLDTKADFAEMFRIASDHMGLSLSGKSFSNDILRVELCGPSQPQLTLVDLPGLIHLAIDSQETQDVQLVFNLAYSYLKNPRSIILAVVSAKNDISNQIILRHARNVDPLGLRTLGIITKPDFLVKGSKGEEAFIALGRNESVKLSLGWHVVKNIDSAISQSQAATSRDQQETLFFQDSSFNRLPAENIGITCLRARLSRVLFSQIRRELPRLVEEIESQITAARNARDKLGPSRSKPEQQREFLISLSQTFQTICRDAVKGDYEDEFFHGDANPERRLCSCIMNMHFNFASNIRKNGASWLIDDKEANDEKCRSRDEAIEEACKLLKRSRGRELPGLPNPLLVGELFRQYSQPWADLARAHIKSVWEIINRFLELLLRHLANEDVCEKILRFWMHPIMETKLELAYSKLEELLDVHRDYPMTTNRQFISHSSIVRQGLDLESMLRVQLQSGKDMSIDDLNEMISTVTKKADLDMDMVAAEEAFDNMNAYYEGALNVFTDNVPTLAIHAPIVRQILTSFCPTAVYSMDTASVSRIAGETEEKMIERDGIMRKLKTLETGARICKQYAQRPQQVAKPSANETLQSSLAADTGTPVKENMHTPQKPSTANPLSFNSLPEAGGLPSIFANGGGPDSLTVLRSDGTRSRSPTVKKSSSTGFVREFTQSGDSEDSKTFLGGEFSSVVSPNGITSETPVRGLFGSTPISSFANISAGSSSVIESSPVFGSRSSPEPSKTLHETTKSATSLFRFGLVPKKDTEASSSATISQSSQKPLVPFGGFARATDNNVLK